MGKLMVPYDMVSNTATVPISSINQRQGGLEALLNRTQTCRNYLIELARENRDIAGQPTSFFSLPRELRDEVYMQSVVSVSDLDLYDHGSRPEQHS